MKKKKITASVLRVNFYSIISDAIDRGIDIGWNHAHKHTDNPGEEMLKQHIFQDIMNELCDILEFDEH